MNQVANLGSYNSLLISLLAGDTFACDCLRHQ